MSTKTTQYQLSLEREDHKEKLHLFRETNAVEQALLKQLTAALLALYLKPYRDSTSNKITTPIRTIITDLIKTYGAINQEELEEKEMALKERIFDITQPLVHLFTAVEDLMELAEASDTPFTEKQQINLGVRLIKNLGEMEKQEQSG